MALVHRLVAAGVLLGLPVALAAQARAVVTGDLVRLETEGRRFHGSVAALGADSLTLQTDGGARRFAAARIGRIDVRTGEHSALLHGGAVGFVAGAAAGALTGAIAGADCNPDAWLCFDRPAMAAILGLLGAGSGLVVGGVIGAFSHRAEWERAALPAGRMSWRLAPVVSPGAVGARLVVSF